MAISSLLSIAGNTLAPFAREVVEQATSELTCEAVRAIKSEMGALPVYPVNYHGTYFTILPAAVRSPFHPAGTQRTLDRGPGGIQIPWFPDGSPAASAGHGGQGAQRGR